MTTVRLQPGGMAPDFTLPDQNGTPVSLKSMRGRRVILYFYPAAMTPGCTAQACDFRDSLASFRSLGYELLGISRDTPEKLQSFRERDGLDFALLSDSDHTVHDQYGAWGEKMNYGKVMQGVIRSTFVIDARGQLEHALYNVKATGHVRRLRALLGAHD